MKWIGKSYIHKCIMADTNATWQQAANKSYTKEPILTNNISASSGKTVRKMDH